MRMEKTPPILADGTALVPQSYPQTPGQKRGIAGIPGNPLS
ncbi:hypothetical protein CYB_0629 [Synechococcus sp. JA-2-3B'a(2-13)]|nr:hypothetical protein CYB_0629 [Synechococcus sp. JA-2-3B'a(2-13)]